MKIGHCAVCGSFHWIAWECIAEVDDAVVVIISFAVIDYKVTVAI